MFNCKNICLAFQGLILLWYKRITIMYPETKIVKTNLIQISFEIIDKQIHVKP